METEDRDAAPDRMAVWRDRALEAEDRIARALEKADAAYLPGDDCPCTICTCLRILQEKS